ncbi:MAG TPA: hypothetical protein VF010_16360, partial [Methylomirabilota bacterium]|nr:hypothetical protein [Methylomirabilota bacterium]
DGREAPAPRRHTAAREVETRRRAAKGTIYWEDDAGVKRSRHGRARSVHRGATGVLAPRCVGDAPPIERAQTVKTIDFAGFSIRHL